MKATTPHGFVYTEPEDYPNFARQLQALADSVDTAIAADDSETIVLSEPIAYGATLTTSGVTANFDWEIAPDNPPEYDLGGGILLNPDGYPAIVSSGWYLIGAYASFIPSGTITANSAYTLELHLHNANTYPPVVTEYRMRDFLPSSAFSGGAGAQVEVEQAVGISQGSFISIVLRHTNTASTVDVTGAFWLRRIGPGTVII